MDIDEPIAAEDAARIVQARVWDRRLGEIMKFRIADAEHRGLADRVHRAYGTDRFIKVKFEKHIFLHYLFIG